MNKIKNKTKTKTNKQKELTWELPQARLIGLEGILMYNYFPYCNIPVCLCIYFPG